MESGFLDSLITLIIGNLGAIFGLSILFAIVAILSKIQKDMANKLLELTANMHGHSKESTVENSIFCDKDINTELTRLLINTQSSRVGLFLFHNGSVFTTNSPIWKVSATHEQAEAGVTQEFHRVQDVKASLLTPLMSPMFTGMDTEGVKNITPDRCPATGRICERRVRIFRITTEAITSSFSRTFLEGRGTRFAIMSPVMNEDFNVVGFVLIEYCHDGFMTDELLQENSHIACRTTAKIFQLIRDMDVKAVSQAIRHPVKKSKWKFWKR